MAILSSVNIFKGFKGVVNSTGPWITVSRTVDITKLLTGRKPGIVTKSFNFMKWMMRMISLRKLIKKLSYKLIKFGWKNTKRLTKFIFKNSIKAAKLSWQGIKGLGKLGIGGFKKAKDLLKWTIKPFVALGEKIKTKTKHWFKNRVIPMFKRLFKIILKPLKKFLRPLLNAAKRVKKQFGIVVNFIKTKAGYVWNKSKTAFTKIKGKVKAFKQNAVMLFSKKKNEVVGKATGFGRDTKAFVLKTKRGWMQRGRAAANWVKNTKLYKGAAASAKFAGKLLGYAKAGIQWFLKIFKKAFAVIFSKILQPIASLIGSAFAAPSAGLSFLFPLICGLIAEFWFIKDDFFKASWVRRAWLFGKYLLNVLVWWVPGGLGSIAKLAIMLAPLFAELGELGYTFIHGQYNEFEDWKEHGLDEYGTPGDDVVFTNETATKINNIEDLRKNVITRKVIYAKHKTTIYNNHILDLIQFLQDRQQQRTTLIQDCNSVFQPTF